MSFVYSIKSRKNVILNVVKDLLFLLFSRSFVKNKNILHCVHGDERGRSVWAFEAYGEMHHNKPVACCM